MTESFSLLEQIYATVANFLVQYSFQFFGAILILLIGVKLSGWLSGVVVKLCERKGLDLTLGRFLANVVRVFVLIFVVIAAIDKFGISITPLAAALGALLFGGSIALNAPLSNYGAGLAIIISRPFVVGNTISVKGVSGVVEEIRLAATLLSNEEGETITIPNKQIVGEILHNSGPRSLAETVVGIAYGSDVEAALASLSTTLQGIVEVCDEPPPQLGIDAFGDHAITLRLRYWVPTRQHFQLSAKVNLAVYQTLRAQGISIPYPRQEVQLLGRSDS